MLWPISENSFHALLLSSCMQPGGHVVADGFLLLYPTELRRHPAPAGFEPTACRLCDNHQTPARQGQPKHNTGM